MTARTHNRRRIAIDWPGLALAIRTAGVPLEEASEHLGKHKGWLGQVSRGEIMEPSFSDGVRLAEYAYDLLGPDRLARYSARQSEAA